MFFTPWFSTFTYNYYQIMIFYLKNLGKSQTRTKIRVRNPILSFCNFTLDACKWGCPRTIPETYHSSIGPWPTLLTHLIPKVIWGNWTIWSIPFCPGAELASKRLFVAENVKYMMSIIPAVVVPLIAQCPLVGVMHSASFCPHHAAPPALCGVHLKKKQNSWYWRSTATTSDFLY